MGKRILAALLAILLFVGEFGATKITGAAGGPASHDPFEQSEYISADNNSDSSISNHPVSRDGVSAEDISGNSISAKDISGNDVSANDISGNDISDSHIFHEQISEEDLSANDSLMEDLSGNDISGNDISADQVTAKDGSGRQAKITVRVRQQATAVTIQGENVVGSGKKIRLYATVAPSPAASQKVSWSVTGWPKGADSKQVKIDQKGNFSATKKAMSGTYTICATAADGSGKSANYTVRVQAPVKTLLVDAPSKVTLYRVTGGDSIGATVSKSFSVEARTSEDAVCKNLEVISDTPGLVQASYNAAKNLIVVKATGQGTGTATITCKTTDGSNIRKAFKVTVVNPPSSITIQLPNGSTGDLAVGYKHKCNVILGTKFGDPGKVNVQCYVTDTKGKEIQNLSFSKDVLNISGKEKVNQSFRVCAKVEGELKLSTYTTCKTRSRIASMILRYNGEDILGEPILKKEASWHKFHIWVKQGGTEYCLASQSTLTTTSDYSITVNSDDMKLEYDSKNKKAEVKSAIPGRYKITVKALDGSGLSKSYYVRYR